MRFHDIKEMVIKKDENLYIRAIIMTIVYLVNLFTINFHAVSFICVFVLGISFTLHTIRHGYLKVEVKEDV